MEKMKGASYKTFQQRRFLTYLYSNSKLTLMSDSLMDVNHWGFITVREVIVPRTWAGRHSWGKAFELMFCLYVSDIYSCIKLVNQHVYFARICWRNKKVFPSNCAKKIMAGWKMARPFFIK
jgi:hypothetical protein